jgi:hypothetical protein
MMLAHNPVDGQIMVSGFKVNIPQLFQVAQHDKTATQVLVEAQ